MPARILLTAFVSGAAIAALSACQTSDTQPAPSTVTVTQSPSATTAPATTSQSSTSASPTGAPPTSAALTRQPCDLLTADLARRYAHEDVQRQSTYDSDPPLPVEETTCYYRGSTREVSLDINPMPTDPTAPVNHFHVIRPENRVNDVAYEAYWFGPAESLVAVKGDLLISVKVAGIAAPQSDQDRADEIELANLIVPLVG
jgi:hypothetical protein